MTFPYWTKIVLWVIVVAIIVRVSSSLWVILYAAIIWAASSIAARRERARLERLRLRRQLAREGEL